MAPKIKITKENIIQASLDLIREGGAALSSAREIAARLGCSTQPIFSNFSSMEDLEKSVMEAAYGVYLSFINKEAESGKYPRYKAYGMGYIRFAKEEKELFKLLFMCDRKGKELIPTPDFDASIDMIMNANGLTREQATLMHLEMWTCVHGIGTMLATSFLSLEWELISQMLTDVYQGVRARHAGEVSK